MRRFGILARSDMVEKTPKDFETGYVGQAGGRTAAIMDEARGRVLFIDEAYEFDPAQGGSAFRVEAVNTLVGLMTSREYNGKMVIVLAGYEDSVERMLQSPNLNPGLRRRFTSRVVFHAFTAADSLKLLRKLVDAKDLKWTPPFDKQDKALLGYLDDFINSMGNDWASAGTVVELAKSIERACGQRYREEGVDLINQSVLDSARDKLLHNTKAAQLKFPPKPSAPIIDLSHLMQGASASVNCVPPATKTATKQKQVPPTVTEEEVKDEADDRGGPHHGGESGVSDEDRKKAAENKKLYDDWLKQLEEDRRREEEERRKLEELERKLREAKEEAERERLVIEKREAEERLRKLVEERARQEAEMRRIEEARRRLAQSGLCPAGYQWYPEGNGFRCGGGSHYC